MAARKGLPATGLWAPSTSTAQEPYLQLLPRPGQGRCSHGVTAQDEASTAWAFWNLVSRTSAHIGPNLHGSHATRLGSQRWAWCGTWGAPLSSHAWGQGKYVHRNLHLAHPSAPGRHCWYQGPLPSPPQDLCLSPWSLSDGSGLRAGHISSPAWNTKYSQLPQSLDCWGRAHPLPHPCTCPLCPIAVCHT